MWFGAIGRHPDAGTDSTLREGGPAVYRSTCFIAAVADHRAILRQAGHTILGEPSVLWPDQ
jgi:hypothetical protein